MKSDRARARAASSASRAGPEADDDGPRVRQAVERVEQEVRRPSRARASRRRRRSAPRRRGSAASRSALPSSGRRSSARPGFGAVAARLGDERRERLSRGSGRSSSTSTPGRHDVHALEVLAGSDDLLEHARGCAPSRRATASARSSDSRAHAASSAFAADRELELRAVRLDDEGHPDRGADRRSEEHVVHEEEVRRQVRADGGGVSLDELVPLLRRADPGGSAPRDRRSGRGRRPAAARRRDRAGRPRAPPRSKRSGCGSWREDDDLVPEPRPGPRERARVDVRARPAQEVAVPEENLHA